ncbi:glycoside hydrolase family 73 protein [Clostridium sp. SGI.024]|uniref:glycoside hydrolase family 73 protein n=1 Tax=Clostridium sp. SGI.024 TaxID=3420551 RepID=UPI003D00AA71
MKKVSIAMFIASFFIPIIIVLSAILIIGTNVTSNKKAGPVVPSESEKAFIEAMAPVAQESYKEHGVLPSITLAQGIIESAWGKSGLTVQGNNLFGIKADISWTGPVIEMNTQEFVNGQYITVVARWRVYDRWEDSILDHGKFLKENIRYEQAGVFNAKNYKEQAEALLRAGYATDPNYSNKLCSMIESYSLDQYDNVQNNTQT